LPVFEVLCVTRLDADPHVVPPGWATKNS